MAAPPIVWADVVSVGGSEETKPALRAAILEHVNFALNEAVHVGPGGKQRGTFKLRRMLLAAHLAAVLTPATEEEDDGSNGGLGPEYAGLITSEKVNNIERKFGGGESSGSGSVSDASSDESLSTTEWGKAYLLLRPPRARLPRVL